MRFIGLCLLLMAMRPLPGAAQQGSISYDLWLVRSRTITEDLIKDSIALTPSERALLWARLAQRWWQDDPEKARAWMLKPIEIVEAVPNKENPDERSERLTTARLLLQIVAPLDQKLSARLVAVLTQDAEQQAKAERAANADGLIEAAVSLVDTEPQRAAELGALALRVGHPTLIQLLIFRLRPKNANLADAVFTQTLAAARQTFDADLLNSLSHVAFPESRTIGAPSDTRVPDSLKIELLKAYIAYVQANQINPETRSSVCITVISLISPILFQFDRLLPQQAAVARQSVNQCQALGHPLAQQIIDDATRDQPLRTVDDLLKAGDDAQDMQVRTVYQYRAAALAKEQKDFDRALKILDSMSTESREFMGGSWEAYRWDWATLSALLHYKSGDLYGMRLIMNAVPADLQPYAKLAFVNRLPANRDKDTDPTLEFLSDVLTGLRRSSVSDAEKSVGYFGLLPLTVKYQPSEATAVLKEAVAALNRAGQAKDKNTGNNQDSSLSGSEFSKIFPASLLEMDEYVVKEAVAAITAPDIRVHVRLELLNVCLDRLRSARQATPNKGRSTPKGE
ncbi:MAG: hypothetical protein QOD75_3465 [Blastocatellia bacterium]|jgi:hypothetical protein|nr:hypothetical protein [Blastocatellia bacterium]